VGWGIPSLTLNIAFYCRDKAQLDLKKQYREQGTLARHVAKTRYVVMSQSVYSSSWKTCDENGRSARSRSVIARIAGCASGSLCHFRRSRQFGVWVSQNRCLKPRASVLRNLY